MTVQELNIIVRAKAEGVEQVAERAKRSIQGIGQAAQQVAAVPLAKTVQNQLDRLENRYNKLQSKLEQFRDKHKAIRQSMEQIVSSYDYLPAATGDASKWDTVEELLSKDKEYQRLKLSLMQVTSEYDRLNKNSNKPQKEWMKYVQVLFEPEMP